MSNGSVYVCVFVFLCKLVRAVCDVAFIASLFVPSQLLHFETDELCQESVLLEEAAIICVVKPR
jgi:hypothetical protein